MVSMTGFPSNDEKRMFRAVLRRNRRYAQEVELFCDWMVEHYSQDMNNIHPKILVLLSGEDCF